MPRIKFSTAFRQIKRELTIIEDDKRGRGGWRKYLKFKTVWEFCVSCGLGYGLSIKLKILREKLV
jgi:hypothetical protein